MNDLNVNLDAKTLEQCLKTVSDFGSNKLINICTGQTNIIPWGTADWALAIFLCFLGLSVVLMFIGFVVAAFCDYNRF